MKFELSFFAIYLLINIYALTLYEWKNVKLYRLYGQLDHSYRRSPSCVDFVFVCTHVSTEKANKQTKTRNIRRNEQSKCKIEVFYLSYFVFVVAFFVLSFHRFPNPFVLGEQSYV